MRKKGRYMAFINDINKDVEHNFHSFLYMSKSFGGTSLLLLSLKMKHWAKVFISSHVVHDDKTLNPTP